MNNYLLIGIVYAFSAAVQPGPLSTYLINQSITCGWKSTLPACFSPILSDGPIILLVLFLLSTIPIWLINLLHFGGAAFIFYLTVVTGFSLIKKSENEKVEIQSPNQTLFKATVVNLLNPAPYLGWSLVMGPLFIKGYHESPINGFTLIIAFYATMAISLAGLIIIFAYASKRSPKVNRALRIISVAALFCFGIYQLWLGINSV